MVDVANKNYRSANKKSKSTARAFLITLVFICGGLFLVVADHVGQSHTVQTSQQ